MHINVYSVNFCSLLYFYFRCNNHNIHFYILNKRFISHLLEDNMMMMTHTWNSKGKYLTMTMDWTNTYTNMVKNITNIYAKNISEIISTGCYQKKKTAKIFIYNIFYDDDDVHFKHTHIYR